MHIPDGYLSPSTCAVGFAVAVPMWTIASKRVSRVVKHRNVPFLALLSALSFIIMMFNIPIPGGTTAHAVGGALVAVTLGPWAAVIAVSVALLFQALLFGDGGVLAYGANCVNLAIILPFVAYGVYRLIAGNSVLTSRRRVVAAAVGGYVGINAAALATAIEFGIQPGLFQAASGAPLYSPYDLSEAIPAMMIPHLTIAGLAEAILCAGVFAFLQHADPRRLSQNHPGIPITEADRDLVPSRTGAPGRIALAFMAVMAVISPIGLLAPGGAFGEAAPEDLNLAEAGISAIPRGLESYAGLWNYTLLDGYGFSSGEHPELAYILSAFIGIAVVGAVIYAIARIAQWFANRHDRPAQVRS